MSNSSLVPVLIVDDEKDNLQALHRLLRNQFDVTITDSPIEAVKLLQRQAYHVIVSDQRMPEMTGVELLEKAKVASPDSVRILLTGYTDLDSVIGAINRGNIYRYIAKPWDPEDFKLTLRQAAEAFQLRRELKEKNEALEKSNRELKRLDQAKASFLSLISHELNTPLTALTAFVSLLKETKALAPEMQKAVDSLGEASDRLAEIVREVLDYVRLESEGTLRREKVSFSQALEKAKGQLKKRGSDLSLVAEKDLFVSGDSDKLELALRKLFEDALARAPEKEKISVRATRNGGHIVCSLTRKGEPISTQALSPLEMGVNPLRHRRNLGLGLATCRLILEWHEGELQLKSSDEKGTTLVLSLPAALP